MNNVSIAFTHRDFSRPVGVGDYQWNIERLEWRAVGGPWSGRLRVGAGPGVQALPRLWALADLLRCGITITDKVPAWWGYVSAVEIHSPTKQEGRGGVARVELDSMWNRGVVQYYRYSPVGTNDPASTSVQQVADSIQNYGTKERVFRPLGQMTAAQANQYLTTLLNQYGQPVKELKLDNPSNNAGNYYAILELRGWWETLDWKFYSDSRGKQGNAAASYVFDYGKDAARTKWAQRFTTGAAGWTASEVWVKMKKYGSPSDQARLELCADGVGDVPGTVQAYCNLYSYATADQTYEVPSDMAEFVRFPLSAPVALAANTRYWVNLSRTGSVNATHYFGVAFKITQAPLEMLKYYGNSVWTAYTTGDMGFMVVGTIDAAEQITRIVDASAGCGQFLSGYRIENTIGVESIPYRDGSTRGREELEQHLRTGTSAGARLLARVESDRMVRVYTQPLASAANLVVDRAGRIVRRDLGTLELSEWPAGQWVNLGAMATAGALPGFDGAVFLEGCSWVPKDGFHILEEA